MSVDLALLKKILIIQYSPYGDVFLTTSYFEQLKSEIPGVEIFYLVKEPYQRIVQDHPYIDSVMTIKKSKGLSNFWERIKTAFRLRRERFDLIIDQQNLPASQVMAWLSGAKFRLGYRTARLSFLYNLYAPRGPVRYSAARKFDILQPLGIKEKKISLHFIIPVKATEYIHTWLSEKKISQMLVFSPGSPVERKRWSWECWVELAKIVIERTNYGIILLWAPNELSFVQKIIASIRDKRVVLAPPTDFQQAGALLKETAFFVCNDGGINHLAAALNIKTLALFGKTSPLVWSPAAYFPSHSHLHNTAAVAGDVTFGITPEMVYAAILARCSS